MSLGVVVIQVTDLALHQAVRYLLLSQLLGILTLAGTGQTPEPAVEHHRNQNGPDAGKHSRQFRQQMRKQLRLQLR